MSTAREAALEISATFFDGRRAISDRIEEILNRKLRNPPGSLMVGTNGNGEVVVNLDQDRTGHIIYSPAQARQFASLLCKKADEADSESRQ